MVEHFRNEWIRQAHRDSRTPTLQVKGETTSDMALKAAGAARAQPQPEWTLGPLNLIVLLPTSTPRQQRFPASAVSVQAGPRDQSREPRLMCKAVCLRDLFTGLATVDGLLKDRRISNVPWVIGAETPSRASIDWKDRTTLWCFSGMEPGCSCA